MDRQAINIKNAVDSRGTSSVLFLHNYIISASLESLFLVFDIKNRNNCTHAICLTHIKLISRSCYNNPYVI